MGYNQEELDTLINEWDFVENKLLDESEYVNRYKHCVYTSYWDKAYRGHIMKKFDNWENANSPLCFMLFSAFIDADVELEDELYIWRANREKYGSHFKCVAPIEDGSCQQLPPVWGRAPR